MVVVTSLMTITGPLASVQGLNKLRLGRVRHSTGVAEGRGEESWRGMRV